MISFTDLYNVVSIDSPQELKLEKIHGTLIILYQASPSSPQLQKICFFYQKLKKINTLQQVAGENTPNLV